MIVVVFVAFRLRWSRIAVESAVPQGTHTHAHPIANVHTHTHTFLAHEKCAYIPRTVRQQSAYLENVQVGATCVIRAAFALDSIRCYQQFKGYVQTSQRTENIAFQIYSCNCYLICSRSKPNRSHYSRYGSNYLRYKHTHTHTRWTTSKVTHTSR